MSDIKHEFHCRLLHGDDYCSCAAAPAPEPILKGAYQTPDGDIRIDFVAPDASASVTDDARFVINVLEAGQTTDDRKAAEIVARLSLELAEEQARGECLILDYQGAYKRAIAAEAELARARQEWVRQRKRADDSDTQLDWMAAWCRRTFGVENNQVIGRDGWPNRLCEVVAKAAEAELARARQVIDAARILCFDPEGDVAGDTANVVDAIYAYDRGST
jgi:hypothetical protein